MKRRIYNISETEIHQTLKIYEDTNFGFCNPTTKDQELQGLKRRNQHER